MQGDADEWRAHAEALIAQGDVAGAVAEYSVLATAYAGSGLLLRAVGICKRILTLDPAHDDTQRLLAELYALRGPDEAAAEALEEPISVPDADAVEILPPQMAPDAPDAGIDVSAIAAVMTKLPQGSVLPERPADVPLFSSLPTASFVSLVQKLDAWVAESGAVVVHEGDASDSVFVVVRGLVRVEHKGVVVARLGAGTFFGEMALLSQKPRTATVVADERTELLEITRATLEQLQKEDPKVGPALERFRRTRLIDNLARTSPLFAGVDPAGARRALSGFATRKVDRGAVVVTQDQPAPGLFIVLQGALQVSAVTHSGPVQLKVLESGDVFGEMSLLDDDVATATVTATADSTVLVLPRVAFRELADAHPALRARLRRLAQQRQAHNDQYLPDETTSAILV